MTNKTSKTSGHRPSTNKDGEKSVLTVIDSWPPNAAKRIHALRDLILKVAEEEELELEETLKWGEPAYLCQQGSTLRMGWKASAPETVALYFNCQSKLVDTFRELYPNELTLEGNRAVLLDLKGKLPTDALKHCISMTLNYHNLKKLPLLGG